MSAVLLHVCHGHVVGGDDGVPEGDLRGHEEGAEHEEGEDGEADVVVALGVAHVALAVKVPGVVQHDAHEEHGEAPAHGTEDALLAVLVLVLLAKEGDHRRVGESHRGGTEGSFHPFTSSLM